MGRTANTKTAIALVLVIISFAMVLLPWMQISIGIMGNDYGLGELIDLACRMEGMTRAQFDNEIQMGLAEALQDLQGDTGLILSAKTAVKNLNKILDGGISLLDAASITAYVGGVLADVDQALSMGFNKLTATDRVALTMISDAKLTMFITTIVLWVLIGAIVAAFAYAIVSLRNGSKTGVIVYAVVIAVPAVATAVGVFMANDFVQSYAVYVTDALDDLLWAIGADSNGLLDLELLHLSAAPIVSVVGAVLAVVLTSATTKLPIPDIGKIGMWNCPVCGASNKLGNAFCLSCGTKRPEKPRCPGCNSEIQEGARFCVKCGCDLTGVVEIPEKKTPVYNTTKSEIHVNNNLKNTSAPGGLRGSMAKPDDNDL